MSADTRVVTLTFDNKQFQEAVKETLSTLEKLDKALNDANSGKSLSGITKSINTMDLSGINNGVEQLRNRFSILGIVGMTVIQRITNAGIDMGKKLASTINAAVNQAKTGGMTRALNLEQAKFLLDGLGADVEDVMTRVDNAVTGTAYSLDTAAKSAAVMFASGIKDGEQMEHVLKTIASTAAMTGAQWEDVSDIFTTIAGQGKVMTEQLRMFEGRGLNVAALISEKMGVTEEEFRDMVTKGKVDANMFFDYMEQAVGDQAKKANDTFSGALSNMKTALSRIGAKFYEPGIVFARDIFNETRLAINSVSEGLDPAALAFKRFGGEVTEALTGMIKFLTDQGAFKDFGNGLSNLFQGFLAILTDFKEVFQEAFPQATTKNIAEVFHQFKMGTGHLVYLIRNTEKFKQVFSGLFNILKIAYHIIKGFVTVIIDIVKAVNNATGIFDKLFSGFQSLTGSVSDATGKTKIFENVSKAATTVIEKLGEALKVVGKFIKDTITNALDHANTALDIFIDKIDKILNVLKNNLTTVFSLGGMAGSLGMIGGAIKGFFNLTKGVSKPGEALAKTVEKIGNSFSDMLIAFKNGDALTNALKPLTDQLKAMQMQIKADAIKDIAIAVFLMAAALMMIASLNPEELARGLAGLTGAMSILMASYAVMMKIMESVAEFNNKQGLFGSKVQPTTIVAGAAAMILIAGAILILAKACTMLAQLKPKELAKGLGSVIVLLGAVFGFMTGMSKLNVSVEISKSTALSIVIIAAALLIMAKAVEMLSKLNVNKLAKGLGSVIVLLGALFGFMAGLSALQQKYEMSYSFVKEVGLAMLLMAASIWILSQAVQTLGRMKPENLCKGLAAVTLFMGEMLGVTYALGKTLTPDKIAELGKVGLAMVGMAAAMWILSKALSNIASISDEGLVNSLGTMALSLLMFAQAAKAMTGSIAGAQAMIIMSVAIGVLAVSLKILASMSLEEIARSLLVLAGALVIMAGVAAALSPLSETLMLVAGALLMMGGSVALVGAGILMLSTGLSILASVGSAAISTLIAMLSQMLIWLGTSITEIAKIIVQGLVAIFQEIVAQAPTIIDSITELIGLIITAINNNIGKIIDCGMNIILAFLKGINQNIESIAKAAVSIISKFIDGISDNLDKLIQSGINLIVAFINGLANGIRDNAEKVKAAVLNLCDAILDAFLTFFGIHSPSTVMEEQGVNLVLGLIEGITSKIGSVGTAILEGIAKIPGQIRAKASQFLSSGKNLISNFLNGLGNAKDKIKEKFTAGVEAAKQKLQGSSLYSVGKNLIQGFLNGLNSLKDKVTSFWNWLSDKAAKIMEKKNQIKSPSKRYYRYGKYIMQGLINGLNELKDEPINFFDELSDNMFSSGLYSDLGNPTITPVLDLSEVSKGANTINSMFGRQSMSMAANIGSSNLQTMQTNSLINKLVDSIDKLSSTGSANITNTFTVNGNDNPEEFVNTFIRTLDREMQMRAV